jgi:hypothetical protein
VLSSLSSINWNDVINKEARSSSDEDLGEVQEVDDNYIFVHRGIISKDKFYIPVDMVESFDGNILRFCISEEYATAKFLKLDVIMPTMQFFRVTILFIAYLVSFNISNLWKSGSFYYRAGTITIYITMLVFITTKQVFPLTTH